MSSATTAAHSIILNASNWLIIRETGLLAVVAKKDTAEIVIIQLTKKYENISQIVPLHWGIKTSLIKWILLIPRVCAVPSRFSFILDKELYIIK